MAATSWLLLLVLNVALARPPPDSQGWWSSKVDNRHHQDPSTRQDDEPSSRDLDIGFTVARTDKGYREDPSEVRGHWDWGRQRWGHDPRAGGDDEPQGMFLEEGGDTAEVITQPLGHKVGEFKLRNDQGYQLSIHVPPSSVEGRPGVLKIDMKATLYRPIYY